MPKGKVRSKEERIQSEIQKVDEQIMRAEERIENIKKKADEEILPIREKVKALNEKKESLQKELDEHEKGQLLQFMQDQNLSVKDLQDFLQSRNIKVEEDPEQEESKEENQAAEEVAATSEE